MLTCASIAGGWQEVCHDDWHAPRADNRLDLQVPWWPRPASQQQTLSHSKSGSGALQAHDASTHELHAGLQINGAPPVAYRRGMLSRTGGDVGPELTLLLA